MNITFGGDSFLQQSSTQQGALKGESYCSAWVLGVVNRVHRIFHPLLSHLHFGANCTYGAVFSMHVGTQMLLWLDYGLL